MFKAPKAQFGLKMESNLKYPKQSKQLRDKA